MTTKQKTNIEEISALLNAAVAGCAVEHLTDQPGEDVTVFRIETPFFNFKIDQQIAIYAYYREEDNLIQFSDRGLYSFSIGTEERTPINMKRHRNFIRASGHMILSSETDNESFVVNTPTVDINEQDLDLAAFVGHYLSLLIFSGEV